MRRILFFVLCFFSSLAIGSTTFNQATRVFTRLQTLSGTNLVLKYSKSLNSNAWTSIIGITINQGMLNDCRDERDLAMVLGHELGHWKYGDPWTGDTIAKELRADQIGYNYCTRLGYNRCADFMLLMRDKYGNESDEVHPDWFTRYRHLRK